MLFEQSLLQRYTYNFTDKQRKTLLASYLNPQLFNAGFSISDEQWNAFLQFVKQNAKTPIQPQHLQASAKRVRLMLKAMIARQLWRDEGYFTVLSGEDVVIRKALETFGSSYNNLLKP